MGKSTAEKFTWKRSEISSRKFSLSIYSPLSTTLKDNPSFYTVELLVGSLYNRRLFVVSVRGLLFVIYCLYLFFLFW